MLIVAILLLLLLLIISLAYYFARVVVYPNTLPYPKSREIEIEKGNFDPLDFDSWEKEEFTITSTHGYNLHALYFPLTGSQKTVVISHGIVHSLYGSVNYMPLFRKRGFNILLYDLRNHGLSGGQNTSFGLYEKDDLTACVDWAFNRLPPGGQVGTMGESMGAAISIQQAARDPRLAFVIADCAYSDLTDLFQYRMKVEYHLPPFPLLNLSNWFCQRINGLHYQQVSPRRDVEDIQTPALFIHGAEDDYILPQMSEEMYSRKTSGIRRLHLAPGAGHAESFVQDPAAYDRVVGCFLKEIGIA